MPEDQKKNISLSNIGGGAAIEKFDEEMAKVLQNISDVNCSAKIVRTIQLVVTIKPNDDRDKVEIEIKCKSMLAPVKNYPTSAFICTTPEGFVAIEQQRPKQTSIFDKGKNDNLLDINQRG